MAKEEKTNVMRLLEQKKIPYQHHTYPHEQGQAVDGVTVAQVIGRPPEQVFKTLTAQGVSKQIYVFVLPVAQELDLKKAAKAVGEKSIALLPVKDLLTHTGYVRGGCSPVGMKKAYPTVFHASAQSHETIVVSAGKIGHQVEVAPQALLELTRGHYAEITIT